MAPKGRGKSGGEVPLSRVLMGLARGEDLESIGNRLGRDPSEIARSLRALARSLGEGRAAGRPPKGPGPAPPKKTRAVPGRVTVHADGASRGNPGKAGIGWVIETGGETLLEGGRYIGVATNNVAEYEAVLMALEAARDLGARDVQVELDSELVVRQINGVYRVKDAKLIERHRCLKNLIGEFSRVAFAHVPRGDNRRADELANWAIDEATARRRSG